MSRRSPKLVGAIIVAVMLAIAVAGALKALRPWHTPMGAAATARALERKLHTAVRYRCARQVDDGVVKLKGVDYLCEPVGNPAGKAFWVATDRDRITGLLERT